MDKKDKAIVEALKENSRYSVRDIAKKTRIRPSTVHQRIQKLLKEGIIEKFTIKLDDKKTGENFIVFMLLNTSKDLGKQFLDHPNLKEAFGITGEYDLLVKFKFSDVEEFNKFIINLRKFEEIEKTLTMIGTVKIKEEI